VDSGVQALKLNTKQTGFRTSHFVWIPQAGLGPSFLLMNQTDSFKGIEIHLEQVIKNGSFEI